jgi:hypothetical protein
MQGISWVDEELLFSEEELFFVQSVGNNVNQQEKYSQHSQKIVTAARGIIYIISRCANSWRLRSLTF